MGLGEAIDVCDGGPRPRARMTIHRGGGIRQRLLLGVSMWHLLADYVGIQGRSGVWVVRGILGSQRAWVARMRGSRVRIGRRPLRRWRSMDHRAIHEPSCCEDGNALEEKSALVGFIQAMVDGTAP